MEGESTLLNLMFLLKWFSHVLTHNFSKEKQPMRTFPKCYNFYKNGGKFFDREIIFFTLWRLLHCLHQRERTFSNE
jgi:hypothetical protein